MDNFQEISNPTAGHASWRRAFVAPSSLDELQRLRVALPRPTTIKHGTETFTDMRRHDPSSTTAELLLLVY